MVVDDHTAGRVAAEYLWGQGFSKGHARRQGIRERGIERPAVSFKARAREIGPKFGEIPMVWDPLYDEEYAGLHAKTPSDFLKRIR